MRDYYSMSQKGVLDISLYGWGTYNGERKKDILDIKDEIKEIKN